jgi:hypothetical protein
MEICPPAPELSADAVTASIAILSGSRFLQNEKPLRIEIV